MSWFALPPLAWFALLAVPLALLAGRWALLPDREPDPTL